MCSQHRTALDAAPWTTSYHTSFRTRGNGTSPSRHHLVLPTIPALMPPPRRLVMMAIDVVERHESGGILLPLRRVVDTHDFTVKATAKRTLELALVAAGVRYGLKRH